MNRRSFFGKVAVAAIAPAFDFPLIKVLDETPVICPFIGMDMSPSGMWAFALQNKFGEIYRFQHIALIESLYNMD